MSNISFTVTDENDLDIIAPLWQKLKAHHRARSERFKERFDRVIWESRRTQLLARAADGGAMHIILAYDDDRLVGYCVTTVYGEKCGEIESIYIEADYRRFGIGTRFMQEALSWMQAQGADRREIGVAAGNEEALAFYARFGFYPRLLMLQYAEGC